tara:strand:+ start:51 stop:245 length:195 start_codon:yes stop_codon:yes gene_type:complete
MTKEEILNIKIEGHLIAYKDHLKRSEEDLKSYIKQDYPQSVIEIQEKIILKAKAKIEAIEDLTI